MRCIGLEGEMAEFAPIQIVHTFKTYVYACSTLAVNCTYSVGCCVLFVIYNMKAIFSQRSQVYVAR